MSHIAVDMPVDRQHMFSPMCCASAGFLDRLRIELRLQGQLQGLGLDKGLVNKLLETRIDDNADGLNDLRLDLSPMRQVRSDGFCVPGT